MAIGHFVMAFEPMFYVALATIALGNGLFLPSLPSQINDLYAADDPRRGRAYNVYYVGLNVGGLLAPLVCGTLGELYGWHYGFGAAGIGMLAGLLIYLWGQKYLPSSEADTPAPKAPHVGERRRGGAFLALAGVALSVTVFRGAYEQIGNTVALWADSGVNKSIGALAIPMTWFQSLNPLLVMLMTPPLLAWWRRRADRGKDSSPARRMATGAMIVAGAYALLAAVAWAEGGARASWVWLVLFFAVFTFGELFILPTGLGLFARLAPPRLGATTVAAWFVTIFSGSLMAGLVGMLWSRLHPPVFFVLLAGLGVIAAAMLRALDGPVRAVDPTEGPGYREDGKSPNRRKQSQ
jgi:POT family proton-dependent oligopeptide transporter